MGKEQSCWMVNLIVPYMTTIEEGPKQRIVLFFLSEDLWPNFWVCYLNKKNVIGTDMVQWPRMFAIWSSLIVLSAMSVAQLFFVWSKIRRAFSTSGWTENGRPVIKVEQSVDPGTGPLSEGFPVLIKKSRPGFPRGRSFLNQAKLLRSRGYADYVCRDRLLLNKIGRRRESGANCRFSSRPKNKRQRR